MGKAGGNKKKSTGTPRRVSWLGVLLLLMTGIVPLGLVGTFLCVYIPPGRFGITTLLGLAFPWLVLASAALGIAYLFFFKKRCLIFFAAILLNFHNLGLSVRLPHNDRPRRDDHRMASATRPSEFKVLSYNVCLFGYYAQDDRNGRKDRIASYIGVEEADILCLQEYYESKAPQFRIRETLRKAGYRHHTRLLENARFYFGNAIFSRFPILRQDTVPGLSPLNALYADLQLPGGDTLRVYTFHLASLRFDDHDKALYHELLNKPLDESVSYKAEAGKIARKVSRAARIHAEQVRQIKAHAAACPYRVLICGDMNENPVSYAYHTLAKGLKDAFTERGVGLGRTYSGFFPAYRIDYIFHRAALDPATGKVSDGMDARLATRHFEVGAVDYSDHRPISAVINY
ncbi:MAG: endonuclease/exonuclease/phosphatase family protein [Bacteroidales bacterium]|nr:endonuclease/exonuclease/phosphatase family protein [Bacteroidales bacterium]